MVPKIVKEEVRNPSHAAHDPVQVSKRILFNFISSMTLDWLDSYRVSHVEVDSFSASFLRAFPFATLTAYLKRCHFKWKAVDMQSGSYPGYIFPES